MADRHSDEFKRDAVRIALTSCLTRRQVASDLGVGLSMLGKWVRAISDEAVAAGPDPDLLRENGRLRRDNRVLREEREVLERVAFHYIHAFGPEGEAAFAAHDAFIFRAEFDLTQLALEKAAMFFAAQKS